MGYAVYEQGTRWAGYGVPAECDHPECSTMIDRGMDYKCETWTDYEYFLEGQPVSGDDDWDDEVEIEREGCEFFFCSEHEYHPDHDRADLTGKPDSREWIEHMLTDESWAIWRDENPTRVSVMLAALAPVTEEGDKK